jgi:hypothetical protein
MSGAILPLPQYAFMAWCSVKAQGQLYLYLSDMRISSGFKWLMASFAPIKTGIYTAASVT